MSGGHPGEIASRLTRITEEIIQAGNVLVFVPDIHELFKVSGGGELSPLDVFLPVVRSGAVPLVGETYSREFKSIIEPRTDFLEQFEVIRVEPMSAEETLLLLSFMSLDLEKQFRVFVPVKVLRKTVEIAERYVTSQPLPSSALNLLKEAFGRASRAGKKVLDEETLLGLAEEELGLPVRAAGAREAESLLRLEDRIHERFINQDEAVGAVADALRQYRSGLSRRGGPIAVFLFVGPTGVGKTELSKILAEVQFGSREELRRFDMSEYQDKTSIFRLIGAPDGETTGDLTDTVREHPYSLILLDEFEKAHPDVLNLFLQVFDDGRLTDSLGRTVEFQNTIIVATSNAHSDYVKAEIERGRRAVEIADDLKK
ncbi:MAG: AAA family ATPase, partial [Candidatus Daviesbacteria bacterium]|nr:AAA family ATPase [Candidatus Daviesbacteria bacterium]